MFKLENLVNKLGRKVILPLATILTFNTFAPYLPQQPIVFGKKAEAQENLQITQYLQEWNLNNGTIETLKSPSDIEKRLATQNEYVGNFVGFDLSNDMKDESLLGFVVSSDTNSFYFNDTDSLEARVEVTKILKGHIGFGEPQNVRTANWSENNTTIFIYNEYQKIYGFDLNTRKNLGDLTQHFKDAFGFVPDDILSANIINDTNNNSPYDDVLCMKKPNSKWDVHLWEDIMKGSYKPLMNDISLEKIFYDADSSSRVISINAANLEGKLTDNIIAIRRLAKYGEWEFMGAPFSVDKEFPFNNNGVGAVKIDPNDENVWYAGGVNGLYITRDGGLTWEHSLLINMHGRNIELTGQSVYVGEDIVTGSLLSSRLYRSDDQGRIWKTVKEFPYTLVDSIHVSRDDLNRIYVGSFSKKGTGPDGVWRSLDKGATWTFHPYDGNSRELITWDIDEDINGVLYASTEIADHPGLKEGLYRPPFFRSTDKGETWEDITDGLPWHVTSIQTHPYENIVYGLTEGPGLYTFDHNNKRWKRVDNGSGEGVILLLDTLNPNRLFMGDVVFKDWNGGAYMSTDSGRTFSLIGLENITVGSLALNKTSTELYAAGINRDSTKPYWSGIYVLNIPK